MIISLFSILYIFVVFILFYLINPNWRIYILIAASLGYIGFLSPKALVFILTTSLIFYISAIAIDSAKEKKGLVYRLSLFGTISFFVIIFLFLKLIPALENLGLSGEFFGSIVVPAGFSFYLLSAISYLSDVYSNSISAEKNVFRFFLYMLWFPKFLSGPIERYKDLRPFLENIKSLKVSMISPGSSALYIVYGAFLKVVVADRLCIYVDDVFSHTDMFGSVALIFGAVMYAFQIYCDFAGYTYFARGTSSLFGIKLNENFIVPYCSENIAEFWRRWHISLSSWLRDYIYIPLGGNRKGNVKKILFILIVFLVSGFWHGAALTFLAWGLLHGFYNLIFNLLKSSRISFLFKGIAGRILNFTAVTFAWIFFRADSIKSALAYVCAIFTNGLQISYLKAHFCEGWRQGIDPCITILFMIAVIILDVISYRRKKDIPTLVYEKGLVQKLFYIYLLIILIMVFGAYGPSITAKTYIYMDF